MYNFTDGSICGTSPSPRPSPRVRLPLGDTIILTLLTYEGINTVQLCGHWALALHYRLIMKKVHRNLWAPSQQFSYFNCFGRSDNEGQFGEFVSICFNYMLAGPSAGWSRVRGLSLGRGRKCGLWSGCGDCGPAATCGHKKCGIVTLYTRAPPFQH